MNKVLITGVAGLIGSHLAEYLLSKGYKVYGIDNLSGGYLENVPKGVIFYEFDLSNRERLAEVFETIKPNYVYHFAAYAAEGLSPFIRNFNYSNNLLCSVNVINECIQHEAKIIFTSSMAVYGHGRTPFVETDVLRPADPYGIAKYAVEMDLQQASEHFRLKYAIVRPHNVIGIRQNIWDKYRNVIGIWIYKILNGEDITIYGDGFQTRAFSDVKFCLPAFEKLMVREGLYNIGSDVFWSLNQTAKTMQIIAQEFGYFPRIIYLEARKEVKDAYCDHNWAKQVLNFKDETKLEVTIREMFQWAKTQPKREVKQMNYELTKGMYGYW